MAINKLSDGRWRVDIQPGGRGQKRVRKTFVTKGEALRFEAHVATQQVHGEPWNPKKQDSRRLTDLIDIWHEQHGEHLRDSPRRKSALDRAAAAMGNPIAVQLTPEKFLTYRKQRIKDNTSAKTLNNILGYINAVYNELRRTQQIDYENPLATVRPIKLQENELSFLTTEQMQELLGAIEKNADNPHVLLITQLCLATGCRWGEAEGIKTRHIGKGRVTFTDTKSGKNRTVPIPAEIEKSLKGHGAEYPAMFTSSIGAFRRALAKTTIELPKGQAAHVLRHSFASHFMMNGGDILTLQRILGHSSIVMTMRYAHLSPDHLNDALKYNPLSSLTIG